MRRLTCGLFALFCIAFTFPSAAVTLTDAPGVDGKRLITVRNAAFTFT